MKLKAIIDNESVCSLSRLEYDDYIFLKSCLPEDLNKKEFTDEEKKSIEEYNKFLQKIKEEKGKSLNIELKLNQINI